MIIVTHNLCRTDMTVMNQMLRINFRVLQQHSYFLRKCCFKLHQFQFVPTEIKIFCYALNNMGAQIYFTVKRLEKLLIRVNEIIITLFWIEKGKK